MINRNQAWDLLTSKLSNKNLVRHCLAVEAVMRELAKYFEASADKWGIVGLLHDGDYELSRDDPTKHTLLMHGWLTGMRETDPEILSAILSHNFAHTGKNPPANKLEWSLYCCDELTGLIVAVALVMPDKKLSSVTPEAVMKKFTQKSFAAGAHREQIALCEQKLGIKLEDFISLSLSAMQSISPELGI
ncbi:MAG: Metal dependent phosphohydrolase [Candidatus Amesbacteria bacterium GW2011_GWB1_47_19]|nr:MAG: Metal dependent phosphohydrolase [Candidatus Amesbacteria bacterium GW2011_GWA1_44_24]KKU31311.1 MAG: Metal dependent phosphohydrolase [Candidatus Amesbacteria bacterium GW2011_GWC1_46_24]KKU67036.1 MAG: Metal dependent phosphohydrolase [Candidatus Amesbacteria bacterium GW2011_GWB1_47_19]OGD04972.1 MAG: hypothetical protein A2379_04325 [Candidatus Amesbacteria bacterium RIFOXYB1_FULL_47_13]HBC72746.1 phosphohydrolase [Candidatus Amesbacteria bacterium]